MFEEARRFSIDVDIIIESEDKALENKFSTIVDNSVFTHFEKQERKDRGIPKSHYKFFYKSPMDSVEDYTLLDILYEKFNYGELIDIEIKCNLIKTIEFYNKIKIPSVDCILGDKLTAYAPNTTGIKYGIDKELEIIKQLFDVSVLFDKIDNIDNVKKAFIDLAKQELEYRELDSSYTDVLNDIITTSQILSFRGKLESDIFKLLETGVRKIRPYILRNYIIEDAVVSASKAAYLATLIKNGKTNIDYYHEEIDLTKLKTNIGVVNKMKKYRPEAFYYWYKVIELGGI